eukprot:CAMPEP_0167780898 /NCGR_PEP_ID=MMETSP0111_2-20121227/5622_1 /TAXON_ID=91324 /ORGANISM="Lotharella globosa, Strain CCCM811" /LENGTH=161 /DNA_ID=CAMNT_0007671479 /DNA_START=98 /DNA_END=583 /DNA_ORIENTATION=-
MDHFCPWVSNTIGYANYRYFLLMLFWTFIGCVYVVSMLTPYVYVNGIRIPKNMKHSAYLLLMYITTFSFAAVLMMFLLFHAMLISTGQTTIDFWGNMDRRRRARLHNDPPFRNPFDLGVRRNWEQVFGRVHWSVAVLPSFREPPWPPYATKEDGGDVHKRI